MDDKERLLDEIADAYGEIDDLVEEHEDEVKRRFAILLNEEGERVPAIWKAGECPIGLTIDALMRVPMAQRDEKWEYAGRCMIACAREQTWIELESIPFLRAAEKHAKRERDAAQRLSRSEKRKVARIGVSKTRFDDKRNQRKEKRLAASI